MIVSIRRPPWWEAIFRFRDGETKLEIDSASAKSTWVDQRANTSWPHLPPFDDPAVQTLPRLVTFHDPAFRFGV